MYEESLNRLMDETKFFEGAKNKFDILEEKIDGLSIANYS